MKKRDPEHGGAMLVTMILIGALLAGGAVVLKLQLASTRSADLTRANMSAVFCAEAGLTAARSIVASNYAQWRASLCTTHHTNPDACTEPQWLAQAIDQWGTHDLDNDGVDDFVLYIHDNDDEETNDLTADNDLRVFVVAKCIKYTDTVKQIEELVEHNGAFGCIGNMIGGSDGDGNSNGGC